MSGRGRGRGGFGRGGRGGGRGYGRGGYRPRQNGPPPPRGPPAEPDTELESRQVAIETKRFFIDIKQNSRGKFMKISEVGEAGGAPGRNKVTFSLSTGPEMAEHLSEFAQFHAANINEPAPEDGRLKSEAIFKEPKRYYFDLKENQRGRFLRICQTSGTGARQQVAVPASGIALLQENVKQLLDDFGVDDGGPDHHLPASKDIRINRKRFYFDVGSNDRGVFMRMSEVTNRYRSSITIPHSGWAAVRDALSDYCDQMPYTEPEPEAEAALPAAPAGENRE